jgi:uncharacterized protein YndB with AHSA1/START domain
VSERTAKHDTTVVERKFKSSPARVFAAWKDPEAYGRWNYPGDDWVMADYENDFRVGGREKKTFGPKGDPKLTSEGTYLDIVPDSRIVSAFNMRERETRISATLCTVELLEDGSGTRLILTDQSVFFDGRETTAMRKSGWGQVLGRLKTELDGENATKI